MAGSSLCVELLVPLEEEEEEGVDVGTTANHR